MIYKKCRFHDFFQNSVKKNSIHVGILILFPKNHFFNSYLSIASILISLLDRAYVITELELLPNQYVLR